MTIKLFNLNPGIPGMVMLLFVAAPAFTQEQVQGKEIYEMYCTQCHGLNGDGRGVNAASMSVLPRDHSDTQEMSLRSDEELYKVIAEGGASINKSVLMPA
ncbi:MAG: c-type cytochrome, partial [Pseudohongiellaceae bacterium]